MDDKRRVLQAVQELSSNADHAAALARIAPLATRLPLDLDVQMQAAIIARSGGALPQALSYLAAARRLAPDDPQIANIEANTLALAGKGTDALAAFERLLAKHPDFLDAHINRALTAQEMGQDDRALQLVDTSLAAYPDHARLLAIRGAILKNLGEDEKALEALDKSLSIDSSRARSHFNRGVILRSMERNAEAEQALEAAGQLGMTDGGYKSALAAVKLELDKVDEAETLYYQSFVAGDPEAGAALTRLRREYRGADDAFDHYARRAAALPNVPEAWLSWANELVDYREFQSLRDVSGRARKLHPDDTLLETLEAVSQCWTGARKEGLETLERLSHRAPDNPALHNAIAEAALAEREPERAERHASHAAQINPADQTCWAYLSTAWRMLGDEREYWLCDYDNFVVPTLVEPTEGGMSAAEYAAEVARILESLHRTSQAPGNQSLRDGTQTSGKLFARRGEGISAFRGATMRAVQGAVARLSKDPSHPLLARTSQSLTFTGSWSVRLRGGGGHHVSHFHGQGWISSAYYAKLPNLPEEGQGTAGYIQFGAPPEHWGLELPPRRVVRPEPGLLVLFPSYMWHGTVPFSGEDIRLTAAFDLVPQEDGVLSEVRIPQA